MPIYSLMENIINSISEEESTLQKILPKFPFIRFPLFNIVYEMELLGLSIENNLEIFSKILLSLLKDEYLQTWQEILENYQTEIAEEKENATLILKYLRQEQVHSVPSEENLLWKALWNQSLQKIYAYFCYKRTKKIMTPKSIMKKMRSQIKQWCLTIDINESPIKNLKELISSTEYHALNKQELIANIQALIPLSLEFDLYKLYDSQHNNNEQLLMSMDYFFIKENPCILKLLV